MSGAELSMGGGQQCSIATALDERQHFVCGKGQREQQSEGRNDFSLDEEVDVNDF